MTGLPAHDSRAAAPETGHQPRLATPDDVATVTRILAAAFHADGIWGEWAFPKRRTRRANRQAAFGAFVAGGLRHGASWLAARDTAAAVWIPPGGSELSVEQEREFVGWLRSGDAAVDRILGAFDMFEEARPTEPHYYLSLLGTAPAFAGNGHAQRLLAHNLARLDGEEASAYLETSDQLVPLYRRFGFQLIGSFVLPDDGPRVNGMWRSPVSTCEVRNHKGAESVR